MSLRLMTSDECLATAAGWEREAARRATRTMFDARDECLRMAGVWLDRALRAEADPTDTSIPSVPDTYTPVG